MSFTHVSPGPRGKPEWKGRQSPVCLCLALLALMLISAFGAPTITSQPQAFTLTVGGGLDYMSVEAATSGGSMHFQWYQGMSGDTSLPVEDDSSSFTVWPRVYTGSADVFYWVRITDDNGSTDSAAARVTLLPAAPINVTATRNLFQDRIRVTWSPQSQSHTFDVHRSLSNNFTGSTTIATGVTGTFYNDTTATAGNTYYYFVRARDTDNQVSLSDSATSPYRAGMRAMLPLSLQGTLIPVREVTDYAFNQDSTELFLALKSGFVERYRLSTRSIINTYYIGGVLRAIDIAPNDAFLLVTSQNTQLLNGAVHKVPLPSGQVDTYTYQMYDSSETGSYDVSILSDQLAIVTGSQDGSGWVPLRTLNPQTGVYTEHPDITDETFLDRTPNRGRAALFYGHTWSFYDRDTGNISPKLSSNASYSHGSISRDGTLFGLIQNSNGDLKVFDSSGTLLQTFTVPFSAGNRFSPVGSELIVADRNDSELYFYNTETWAEMERMPIEDSIGGIGQHFDPGYFKISPNGNRLAITTTQGVRVLDTTYPQAPTSVNGFAATDLNLTHSDRVRLAWTAVPEAASYMVYRHTEDNSSAATLLNGHVTATQYDDTTAVPLTQYYYWVKAKNRAGITDFSAVDAGMRPVSMPGSLSASTNNVTTLTVSWTFETAPGNFEIYRGLTNQFGDATLIASVASTIRSHVDTNAAVGTVYYYWVRKVWTTGPGDFSGPAQGYKRLATPTGLTATTHLGDRVTVTWQPVPGAQQYQVYFKTTQTGFNGTERLVGTTTNTTIDDPYTNFSPGITYYWSVRAVSGINMSAFPNGVAGRRVPVPPQTVTATSNLLDRITVSWSNENDGTTHYRVLRSQTNNPATASTVQNLTAATTQWSDLTAGPNVTYYYWVISFTFSNPPVESSFSSSAAGRRLGLGFPDYQARYNLSGANAVLTNDPDGDQYPTILEWGLGGTNPLTSSSAPPFQVRTVTVSGETYQAICYLRLITGVESGNQYQTTYLRYEAEATSDLVNWALVPVAATPPSGLSTPPDGYEWGCFRMPGSVAQYPTGFLRLRLSQNTP